MIFNFFKKKKEPGAKISLLGQINIPSFLQGRSLNHYKICASAIGVDAQIHLLLTDNIPDRIQGMFVPTESNAHYQALSIAIDWQTGHIKGCEVTDFGILEPNIHFIQRHMDGFLLLGARAQLFPDGQADLNGLFIDKNGQTTKAQCFGDGIQQCLVDNQNRIITSYFDEGIFGNNGWFDPECGSSEPIGVSGLVVWSPGGEQLWKNHNHDICDCYAINLDLEDHLWFYYYSDFNLVKTNYESETVYQPDISGCSGFLFHAQEDLILFDRGYNQHGLFVAKRILQPSTSLSPGLPISFAWKNKEVKPQNYSFRSSKALIWDGFENMYFTQWRHDTTSGDL